MVRVLHAFMGFFAFSVFSSLDSGVVEETIATLARMGILVGTPITRLRAYGSEKVGGFHQKLYSEKFSGFLPAALLN